MFTATQKSSKIVTNLKYETAKIVAMAKEKQESFEKSSEAWKASPKGAMHLGDTAKLLADADSLNLAIEAFENSFVKGAAPEVVNAETASVNAE